MDQSIALISTIQARWRVAYEAGQARDSHGIHWNASAIADFQAGWDEAAQEHYGLPSAERLAADQVGAPVP